MVGAKWCSLSSYCQNKETAGFLFCLYFFLILAYGFFVLPCHSLNAGDPTFYAYLLLSTCTSPGSSGQASFLAPVGILGH